MSGWELLANDELARSYERFVKAIYKGRPGSRLRFSFRGTVLGLNDFLGPRSGKLIVTVDGKRSEAMRFDRHCSYDRLANVILFENLEDKVHDVEIEVSGEQLDKASILGPEHLEKMKKSPAMFKGIEYKIGSILIVGDLVSSAPRELEAGLKRADDLWRARKTAAGGSGLRGTGRGFRFEGRVCFAGLASVGRSTIPERKKRRVRSYARPDGKTRMAACLS